MAHLHEAQWNEFAKLLEHFRETKRLGQKLASQMNWSELADDFVEDADSRSIELLYEGLRETLGDCPYDVPEFPDYDSLIFM